MSHVYFIIICIVWGSTFMLMKEATACFGPAGIASYRLLSGAAALGLLWVSRKKPWPLARRDFFPLLFIGLVGYSVPFVAQPYVIKHTGSGAFMGIFMSFTPILIAVASVPMLGQWPTRRQTAGVLGGMAFLAVLWHDAWHNNIAILDVALAASVPLTYAITYVYVKRRFNEVSAMALTCACLAMGGIVLLPVTLAVDTIKTHEHFPLAIASVLALGLLSTALANFLFYLLVQSRGPLYAGISMYIIPLVAVAWGWLDREPLTGPQIIALLGNLAMVAMVQYRAPGAPVGRPEAMELPPD